MGYGPGACQRKVRGFPAPYGREGGLPVGQESMKFSRRAFATESRRRDGSSLHKGRCKKGKRECATFTSAGRIWPPCGGQTDQKNLRKAIGFVGL